MSNVIKRESEEIVAVPISFLEFKGMLREVHRPDKNENQFKKDDISIRSDTEFKRGDEFSFGTNNEEIDRENQRQGEAYLEEIKKMSENVEKEAYLRGLELGRKAGYEEMKSEFCDVTKSLHSALSEISGVKEEIYSNNENEMIDLIMLIAKKVIHREVDLKKDTLSDLLRWITRSLTGKDEIILKINPDDMETAVKLKEDFKKTTEEIKGVTIEEDSSITKGGCLIETSMGSIDARIEPQINEIEKILRKTATE